MTQDQKWEYIKKTLTKMQDCEDKHTAARKAVGLDFESPLVEPMHRMQDMLIDTLSIMVGDDFGSLGWYITECDYGLKPMEAGCTGNMRKIQTVDDVRWLIELDCT